MTHSSEGQAVPPDPTTWPQFQLWHLLALVVVCAVALGLFTGLPRVEYPLPDLEHARRLEAFQGWRLKEKFGDTQGPYRQTTSYQFNAQGQKIVHYIANRQRQTRDLTANQEATLAAFFTNPEGNDAVLIFVPE